MTAADDRREVLESVLAEHTLHFDGDQLVCTAGDWRGTSAAAVEALAEHWATDPHALHGIANVGEVVAYDLRAALADSVGALAKHDAEVLRAAARRYDETQAGPSDRTASWLRAEADHIEAP